MNIVLFGAPGSGKGSQASRINAKYGLVHISTGDVFRDNMAKNTPLGKIARTYIDKGNLVPDELTIEIVKDRLAQSDCKNGFILDGFPRNLAQAKALEKIVKIDLVIFIDVSMSEIEIRAVNRRICPKCGKIFSMIEKYTTVCDECGETLIQREDDKIDIVRTRIKNYLTQSEPVVDYYKRKKLLHTILSGKSADETFVSVDNLLSKYMKKKDRKWKSYRQQKSSWWERRER